MGGWARGTGKAVDLGSLLVGVYEDGVLRYAGKVGAFSGGPREELLAALEPLSATASPFDPPPPRSVARTAEWVIAALIDFLGQIQARDLVRFLRHAAANPRNTTVTDRILAPRAIRDAIRSPELRRADRERRHHLTVRLRMHARLTHSSASSVHRCVP